MARILIVGAGQAGGRLVQNLLSKIPEWNETIIETERKRIIEKSNCSL